MVFRLFLWNYARDLQQPTENLSIDLSELLQHEKYVRNPGSEVQKDQTPKVFVIEFYGFSTGFGSRMFLSE